MAPVSDTKKELILQIARRDPFLKIDEIAESADTTPRYVRTILSEAKVSLMDLRRTYARRMEQRLEQSDAADEILYESVPLVSWNSGGGTVMGDITIGRTVHRLWADYLGVSEQTPLFVVNRPQFQAGKPLLVNQIVLPREFRLASLRHGRPASLREIVGLVNAEVPSSSRQFMVVEPADKYVAELLGLGANLPVLRSGSVLFVEDAPAALEFIVFDAYKVEMRFERQGPPRLVVNG